MKKFVLILIALLFILGAILYGLDAVGLINLEEMTNLIKSSKGVIKIKILRDSKIMELDVEVKELNKPAITYQRLSNGDKNVGYIYIDSFTTTVSNQVKSALDKMVKAMEELK